MLLHCAAYPRIVIPTVAIKSEVEGPVFAHAALW